MVKSPSLVISSLTRFQILISSLSSESRDIVKFCAVGALSPVILSSHDIVYPELLKPLDGTFTTIAY